MVILGLAAAGCGGASTGAGTGSTASIYTGGVAGGHPQRGGTLTFALSSGLTLLNPEQLGGLGIPTQIWDQLVELVPGSDQPQPAIATSWSVSPDGLTYDFKLRPGVRFSNGTPLTAADVVYTLRRMTTSANTTGQFIFPTTFKSLDAVGPYEVRFVLTKPVAAMLYNLADPALSIFPKNLAGESESQFASHPIGSGAFMVKSYSPGKSLALVRNPHYWRHGQPYLDGINYALTPNANQRVLSVRSGQADVADTIPYSQINPLRHTPGVVVTTQREYAVDDVFWNTSKAPLTDVNARRALAYATPVQSIIKAVYHGYAEPANTIMPKMQYWDPSVPYYSYDLAKAKALMRASSVPHGFSATFLVAGGDPDGTLVGTILQSAWAKLGVKLAVRQIDSDSESTSVIGGKYQIGWFPTASFINDVAAPDDAAGLVYDYNSGTHALGSFLNSPQSTRLYHEAIATTKDSVRARDFRQLQATSQAAAQMLPIAFVPTTYLVSPRVRNFSALGGGWVRFDRVYLDR